MNRAVALFLATLTLLASVRATRAAETASADLCIYGGTSAGVIAAI